MIRAMNLENEFQSRSIEEVIALRGRNEKIKLFTIEKNEYNKM
jgi:hypothetical protein